ncbi:MAG: efflux RND transporter permease subunit [Ignavibacteria bacterium]|nr:efflux RND transporter permease subunit [Ignavibacteria bacterium]MBI3766811.1 efflux RND transporter permease subunit [Ignavibacteriales bacterium]
MTLTELSIKRPTFIVVIFAVLGVLGLFGYSQLKYELLPKITPPWITIITIYPGASPNEVESSITKLIEDAVSGIDKVSTVYGTSQEGLSIVSLEFQMSADINIALQDAQRKVNEVTSQLPDGAKNPTLTKFALDEFPVLRMGVTANMPSREFYQMIKDRVLPRLAKLAGVGQITLIGGDEREIKVNIDAQKLRSYGISLLQVSQLLKTSNLDFPTGKVKQGDVQFVVRLAGKFSSTDELRQLVVGQSKQGGNIRLADIAEVQDGQKDFSTISRIDGKTSVGVLVQKQGEANSVEVSKIVRTEIPNIEKDFADIGLKFNIAQDGSTFTTEAADAVKHDLMLAIMFVAVVMLAFLHSVRNSIIVMIAIPASLISTFIGMYAFGFSLNLMTLLGMSLVIGILVDDSIVVLENIYRHLEKGDDQRTAALKGRNEIGFAALSITLVDIVVFVPLALVTGLVGNIMREFALVVVFSTLMSLFVSFTITPLLASRFAKLERLTKHTVLGRFALWFEQQYHQLTKQYIWILAWSLSHRGTILFACLLLFVASLMLVPFGFIGTEFMTQVDRGEFTVSLELPAGSTIENTNRITREVEQIIAEISEVRKTFVNVGVSSEGFVGQSSNNISEVNVSLIPKEERKRTTDDITFEIKEKIHQIPGVKVRVNPIGIFGTANQSPIALIVGGTNYDEVRKTAAAVLDVVKTVPGTADVRLSSEEGKPETRIEIDREKMADLGLTLGEVGQTLRVAFNGDDESKFRDGANEYPIRIVLDQFDRSKTTDVGNLTFVNRKGQIIELKQFAHINLTAGPTKLQRQDRNYAVTVFSQAVGRPSGTIVGDIKTALANKELPPGITISYLGDEKNRTESFSSLMLALMAAVLFVYMIMVALYDSYVYPFVVLFSIPVAIIGALLALALMMKSLNIFSILGVIMLVGLVGKNAILLVDRTNQMRQENTLGVIEALLEAAETRLRPILMTTASMIVGMLPIALSISSGSEWKSGLAWALIGGLTSSLLLTLILVPVVYVNVDRWREAVPAFLRRMLRKPVLESKEESVPGVIGVVKLHQGE